MNERVLRLEEKIAYLERHLVEQDKAMLEMAEEIAALRRGLRAMREQGAGGGGAGGPTDDAGSGDGSGERPPHY